MHTSGSAKKRTASSRVAGAGSWSSMSAHYRKCRDESSQLYPDCCSAQVVDSERPPTFTEFVMMPVGAFESSEATASFTAASRRSASQAIAYRRYTASVL